WYVLSASGFYEVTPGMPIYALGTPLFPRVKYRLEDGKTFTITAKNVSDKNFYVKKANLDGNALHAPLVSHADIMKGGLLEFEMSDSPIKDAFDKMPTSDDRVDTVAVPRIEVGPESAIFMSTVTSTATIYYTLNGQEPTNKSTIYLVPFKLREETAVDTIKAIS